MTAAGDTSPPAARASGGAPLLSLGLLFRLLLLAAGALALRAAILALGERVLPPGWPLWLAQGVVTVLLLLAVLAGVNILLARQRGITPGTGGGEMRPPLSADAACASLRNFVEAWHTSTGSWPLVYDAIEAGLAPAAKDVLGLAGSAGVSVAGDGYPAERVLQIIPDMTPVSPDGEESAP